MENVSEDFSRLHGTATGAAESFDATKTHPVFGAAHSMILAHRYGKADPYTYMNHPGLRGMDTRQAALEGMQKLGEGVRRVTDMYRPSIPGPLPPMPGVNRPAPPTPPPSDWIG